MFFHQRFIPGLAIASYVVGDEKTKQCAVIDPTRDVDEYIQIARKEGMRIAHIFETHVHADFVSGAPELKARCGGAPVIHCSGMGGEQWTPPYADHVAKDGDEVRIGSLRIRALHTPGHTPEHMSWALFDETRSKDHPWLLFTGDFLFVGDVGRPDLLGETERAKLAHQLYESVFQRIAPLPDYTEIFPAHGAGSLCGKAIGSRRSSSLGFERRFNPSLQQKPENDWTESLLRGMPPAPPYFKRMKQVNAKGAAVLAEKMPGQKRIAARELHDRLATEDLIVLDTRPKEAFASAHIPKSISIPLAPNLPSWAGWILPYDKPIVLVTSDAAEAGEVVTHLIRIGFDRIDGFLEDGIDGWQSAGFELAHVPTMSVHELSRKLDQPDAPFVLDVRTDGEWNAGHIDGATHIEVGTLVQRAGEVPKDTPVAVVCGSGYRSSIVTSHLKRLGHENLTNVMGGMGAWKAANLPTSSR
jgi:hydroxyacylglutathione hydrolase